MGRFLGLFSSSFSFASSFSLIAVLSVSALVGCSSSTPPPLMPDPMPPEDSRPIAMGSGAEMRSLRPMLDQQRERLREIIDLAERRELHEGGPHMLRACKEESRNLDRLEARVEDIMRMGGGSDTEVDAISDDLRRFSTRLDSLTSALR
jgi:hypothetical protein